MNKREKTKLASLTRRQKNYIKKNVRRFSTAKIAGDLSLAEENLKKAIAVSPQNTGLYTNLGIVYLKLEEKEKAKEAFQKALGINPNDQRTKQQLLILP